MSSTNENNNSVDPNLWNKLTQNNPNSHKAMSYGPASARTQHAYQGRRGNFNGTFDKLICDSMTNVLDSEISLLVFEYHLSLI